MKRLVPVIVAISVSAGGGAVAAARAPVPSAGSLGRAIEVPGLAALNTGGDAQVTSVSCASAGNCTAGGYYNRSRSGQQGFVVDERRGRWGKAIEVPGLAALNTDGDAQVTSVSCASAGDCAAGGFYQAATSSVNEGFVVTERHGRWGKAIEVPGLAPLNTGRSVGTGAQVTSVSCGSPGNCAAGGYYTARGQSQQGFVATERKGRWGNAIEVPGLGALNTGGDAAVSTVSCGSASNCAAGGFTDEGLEFVTAERHGVWSKAIHVPGLAGLKKGSQEAAEVSSVACASSGYCAAAGGFFVRGGGWNWFAVAERNGRWGKATEIPSMAALKKSDFAEINSLSCRSPGNCTVGGSYFSQSGAGFVATERNGHWGKATKVPGLAALSNGRQSEVQSVSCTSASNCTAAGDYLGRSNLLHDFVASQRNGRWSRAIEVPGLAALDKGSRQPFAQANFFPVVSCAPRGTCVVGGAYADASNHAEGYVTATSPRLR